MRANIRCLAPVEAALSPTERGSSFATRRSSRCICVLFVVTVQLADDFVMRHRADPSGIIGGVVGLDTLRSRKTVSNRDRF
jgi:hypothetical protein